jgi:asparagine synthase (glutamine-hydrolysing)
VIPRLPSLYDEPFADSSQIPTFLVSELARRHVTVSLSGDAGDELFGGYNLYRAGRFLWRTFGWMPSYVRRMIGMALNAAPARVLDACFGWLSPLQKQWGRTSSISDKLHKLVPVLASTEPELMRRALVANWRGTNSLVLGAPMLSSAHSGEEIPDFPKFVQYMMYADLIAYLPDDILVKVDRASMGVSLEARVPFLDHRVIEFAWRIPLQFKLHRGITKWILRQVLYRYVPRQLVDRPKSGFAVPVSTWLRGPLREFGEDMLAESRLRQDGWFDPRIVRTLWREHLQGRRNWEQPLWSLLIFQAWLAEQNAHSARLDQRITVHAS